MEHCTYTNWSMAVHSLGPRHSVIKHKLVSNKHLHSNIGCSPCSMVAATNGSIAQYFDVARQSIYVFYLKKLKPVKGAVFGYNNGRNSVYLPFNQPNSASFELLLSIIASVPVISLHECECWLFWYLVHPIGYRNIGFLLNDSTHY